MLPGLFDCYAYSPLVDGCNIAISCSRVCSILLIINTAVIILPSIVISTILYISLFWKAKKIKKSVNAPANIQARDEQNAAKKEWRATTITFSLMFLALYILLFPFFFYLLVLQIMSAIFDVPRFWSVLSGLLFNLITFLVVMDPIFIMRNRDVREVLSEISWMPKCLV